jgi:hypothetical protein
LHARAGVLGVFACLLLSLARSPISSSPIAPPRPRDDSSPPRADPVGWNPAQVRDVHNEIRGWAGTETNALTLLTWSAIVKLLEPYGVDLGRCLGVLVGC